MKKLVISGLISFLAVGLTSCFKTMDLTMEEFQQVEFDLAVRTTPASGVTYPIIATTRTAGVITPVVTLVGPQLKASEELTYSVDTAISQLLNASTIRAVEGVHYNLNGGKLTLKPDTSFSTARLTILNPGASAGKSALLVLKLDGNSRLQPAENYRRIGYRINLN